MVYITIGTCASIGGVLKQGNMKRVRYGVGCYLLLRCVLNLPFWKVGRIVETTERILTMLCFRFHFMQIF